MAKQQKVHHQVGISDVLCAQYGDADAATVVDEPRSPQRDDVTCPDCLAILEG